MKQLFLFMLLCLLLTESYGQHRRVKPNVIVILADDLGYGDTEPYGQTKIRTLNISRLANEGMRFTQFYAGTSVCAPSRSSFMTGLHTGHTYIRGNKEVEPEGQQPIPDSAITIGEVAKQAGYVTGIFGKWGLGPVGSEGDPLKQGFDRFYGYNCQLLAHRYYPVHLWDNDIKLRLEGNDQLLHPQTYAPELIQREAMKFLEEHKAQPFMLLLTYTLPHAELLMPEDSIFESYKGAFPERPYKGNDYGGNALKGGYASQQYPHAAFASMVTRLDLYIGQVMNKLKELDLDENTLVIFTSDNGPHLEGGADPAFFNSGGGLRGYKRDLYEGGIRVPFIVRWPGKIKARTVSDHQGAFWDVLATFSEITKAPVPMHTDGISFLPSLLQKKQQKHASLYFEFHENGGTQAIRRGNWKLVKSRVLDTAKTKVELFDLAKDPYEEKDLAPQNPEKVKVLLKEIERSHKESSVFPFLGKKE